ncbi:MAG: hypothetical protein AAFV95_04420 [Bacteroidota bacterium]
MNHAIIQSENVQRAINLIIQATLVLILIFGYGIDAAIPLKFIVWQGIHFFLIALCDFYFDDYQHKTPAMTAALYACFPLFILYSIGIGAFDQLYIRIHIIILIIGSLVGNKLDNFFWKILTLLYVLIIVAFEIHHGDIYPNLTTVVLYTIGSILLVAISERLSEINRNLWMFHVAILFFWIIFEGPFYEQSYIYLVAGVSYESSKILFNNFFLLKKKMLMNE